MMSSLASDSMWRICVPERGTMVLRRVRIMIGGASPAAAFNTPSSEGSADIAAAPSTLPPSDRRPWVGRLVKNGREECRGKVVRHGGMWGGAGLIKTKNKLNRLNTSLKIKN